MEISLLEYNKAKKAVENFEIECFKKHVEPLTCVCCKTQKVTPDFEMIAGKPDPTEQHSDVCWDGGAVTKISGGYGSQHDMSSYIVAICDDCLFKLKDEALIKRTDTIKLKFQEDFQIKNEQGRIYAREIPKFADVMTVEVWNSCVEDGSFINDDGCGYWVKDDMESRDEVFSTPQQDATHVAWYNK